MWSEEKWKGWMHLEKGTNHWQGEMKLVDNLLDKKKREKVIKLFMKKEEMELWDKKTQITLTWIITRLDRKKQGKKREEGNKLFLK